jgi:hypothetical protein
LYVTLSYMSLYFIIVISLCCGALFWDFVSKKGNKSEQRLNFNEDEPLWDIGAYSNAWWERDKIEN